jgi:hypothetical protein
MQVYNDKQNNTNQNSAPTCSYCRDPHHRATDCPHVASDWASFQRMEIPSKDPNHWTHNPVANTGQRSWNTQANTARWYMRPDGWSKWYAECEKANAKQQQARARQATTGTARKASRCGFCGSLHHNRRQCPEMTAMLDRFVSANQGWRQRFYDRFVADLGLSVGAVVKVNQKGSWREPDEEKIGIITAVNWDELSMFCWIDNGNTSWNTRVDHKFTQQLQVRINVDGKDKWLCFDQRTGNNHHRGYGLLNDTQGDGLVDCFNYGGTTFIETIARSETPLDEEWVTQAHRESLQFLVKKYSMEKLTNFNVIALLEKTERFQQNDQ